MTHEELIRELRNSKGWPNLGNAAADCIEQLVKKRDKAEAKLARAIETLQFYVDTKRSARASLDAILAELEKTE